VRRSGPKEDGKVFDSETGQPLYHVRGCRRVFDCGYPYCQCKVKHDRFDVPRKAIVLDSTFWVWTGLVLLSVCVWVAIIWAVWSLLSWLL
jgi:hypothetical protein